MAQYASLSEPDPEWIKIAPSLPSFYMTDVVEFRNKFRAYYEAVQSQMETTGVFESPGITVQKHDIIADGHSIPCRTYVPEIKPEMGETSGQKFPLLYWTYGGGFCIGTLDDNDGMLRSLAVDLRITCVSVDYRKAPENPFPAGINDAYAGLKWALASTEYIHVDVSKGVLIGGVSAGGNLTAVIAHRALKDDEVRGRVTGQLLIIPVTIAYNAYPDKWKPELLSMDQNKDAIIVSRKSMELYTDAYLGGKPENGLDPDFSPLLASSFEGLPPAYIQISGGDPLRDEAFLYHKLLKEAGVITKVDVYPGVPHGFHALAPNFPLSMKQDVDFRTAINWLLGRTEQTNALSLDCKLSENRVLLFPEETADKLPLHDRWFIIKNSQLSFIPPIDMAQYAPLSEPDSEWIKSVPDPSTISLYTTDIPAFRNTWQTICDNAISQMGPAIVDGVLVKEHEIAADGYSIPCRTYVPEPKSELGETPEQKFPLLFWSYAGGFCLGTLNDNDGLLRSLAVDLRITCVSIDYRKAPENPFPAGLNDDYAGFKWALANLEAISVDISKGVLVGGFSAGANMSAVISQRALKDDEVRGKITGQILISPFLIFHEAYPDKWKSELLSTTQNADAMVLPDEALKAYTVAYLGGKSENGFNPDFSPLLAPSFEGLPPAYTQIAGTDPLRDEAFLYDKCLKEAGVTTRVDVYPGVPHGFHAFVPDFYLSKKQDADFRSAINWLLGRRRN